MNKLCLIILSFFVLLSLVSFGQKAEAADPNEQLQKDIRTALTAKNNAIAQNNKYLSKAPVWSINGEIQNRNDSSLIIWGIAVSPHAAPNHPGFLIKNGNIQINGYDKNKVFYAQYIDNELSYLSTKQGKNAFGGAVPVRVFGKIPSSVKKEMNALTAGIQKADKKLAASVMKLMEHSKKADASSASQLTASAEISVKNATFLKTLGYEQESAGLMANAHAKYTASIQLKKDIPTLLKLTELSIQLNKEADAINALKKVITLNKNILSKNTNTKLWYYIGMAYVESSDNETGKAFLLKHIDISDEDSKTKVQAIREYVALTLDNAPGSVGMDESVDEFKKALNVAKKSEVVLSQYGPQVYTHIIDSLLVQSNSTEALRYLEDAAENVGPADLKAPMVRVGTFFAESNHLLESYKLFKEAYSIDQSELEIHSVSEKPYYIAGLVHLNVNMEDSAAIAQKLFESALLINPEYAEAHNGLGYAIASQSFYGDPAGFILAVNHFKKAIELKPEYKRAYGNLYNLYSRGHIEDGTSYDQIEELRLKSMDTNRFQLDQVETEKDFE